MNRIGWAFLAIFMVVAGLMALLIDFGGASPPPKPVVADTPAGPSGRPPSGQLVLPVRGIGWSGIRNSYGEARGGGERGHTGVDIMAPAGAPVTCGGSAP